MKILPLLFTLTVGHMNVLDRDIEINPLEPTPFNDNVEITIENRNTLRRGESIDLKVRSHPIGSNTYSESLEGMPVNPSGVTVLLIINGKYRLNVANINCNPMTEQLAYFNRECQMKISSKVLDNLQDNKFILHAIALNSYNESIKARGAMAVKVLNYGSSTAANKDLERALKKPYILYNEPYGSFNRGEPILLDFYLSEGLLSRDGNKVDLYIDDQKTTTLTSWVPYEIVNLPPGQHKIKLVLIDRDGDEYPSPFPSQESVITIK